jgi:putative ATP-dependent endonuclease of OLD family
MYLSELKLWNFRKYGIDGDSFHDSKPGLTVRFQDGVNVLIGENNSGKTTIVDAIRYILKTQSGEPIYVDEKDFHDDVDGRTSELKIECTFRGFSNTDAGHFLEWIGFETNPSGENEYVLRVWLYAKITDDNDIRCVTRAGLDTDGAYLEGEAKDLLKVVYLRPLRDALTEMTHGYKSRLAQILKSHTVFKKIKDANGKFQKHQLEDNYKSLKNEIDSYFSEKDGKGITEFINGLINKELLFAQDTSAAAINLTGSDLPDILRLLDLVLESNKSGLGSLNLLCIAAELLLLEERRQGLKLTLIEELEAHLHPQQQLRLIDYITKESKFGQFILTTHSTTLASKIDLNKLIICNSTNVFPMGNTPVAHTELDNGDYKFLSRFLDATKSNLFFARGVIIVEGDAENLLIPTFAELLDRPLHKYGVSIVNVGSRAFKRYAKIFIRKNEPKFNVPVAIISDLDVRSIEYFQDKDITSNCVISSAEFITKLRDVTDQVDYSSMPDYFETKSDFVDFINNNKTCGKFKNATPPIIDQLKDFYDAELKEVTAEVITELRTARKTRLCEEWHDKQPVQLFLPENWTLEYELASSKLYKYLIQAYRVAQKEKSVSFTPTGDLFTTIKTSVETEYTAEQLTDAKETYSIFRPLNEGIISKAGTAQYLAEILSSTEGAERDNVVSILKTDQSLKYIRDAIYYVTESESKPAE